MRPMLEIVLPEKAEAVDGFRPTRNCKRALKNSPENQQKAN
jgi:hypothetical protein